MWDGDEQAQEDTRALRFVAIELGQSVALGGDVRLELAPGTTVLVGRNGTGKSAILENIHAVLRSVVGWGPSPPSLSRVTCDLQLRDRTIQYQCTWIPAPVTDLEQDDRPRPPTVEERCALVSPLRQLLWQVHQGRLTFGDSDEQTALPGKTLLQWLTSTDMPVNAPREVLPLFNLFAWTSHVRAGGLRDSSERSELILPRAVLKWKRSPEYAKRTELGKLMRSIAFLGDEPRDEIAAIGRRIGAFQRIEVKHYRDPDRSSPSPNDFVAVSVDGVDLGLLSDGTLRVLQLLLALLSEDTKLLLIDEPESAVHPGLLGKLLHEISAYSADRQIVISTHSPQVVSWALPEAIRVVTRTDGATRVQALGERTIRHLEKYLHDEDTLGQFIYGGGLDGIEP